MKAVVIEKPNKLHLKEVEKPVLKQGFVLIKVKAAAICATDLEVFSGNIPAKYPNIPGHEWSGIVEAVEDESDNNWVGKRVVGSNDICCLKCSACRNGEWRNCSEFREIGFWEDGGYAEYMQVPTYALYELPDNVSFIQGALIEPMGVAVGTLEKANAKAGDTLLIMGAGSIGLNMLAVAKAMGLSKIVVAAQTSGRLGIAKEMGAYEVVATGSQDLEAKMAEIHPNGTDIIIEATGIEECIQKSLRIAKKGGCIALAGYGRGKMVTLKIDDIHIKNLRVVGAGNNWNMVSKCLKLLEAGVVNTEHMATDLITLADYEKGIELAEKRPNGFLKAVFVYE